MNHERIIKFQTTRTAPNRVEVAAELKDVRKHKSIWGYRNQVVHHMTVKIVADTKLIIKEARFETIRAPYIECQSHVVTAERLVGLSLAKGFTKQVLDLYGGTSGCSHILTILTDLAPAIRQGFAFSYVFPEEETQMTEDNVVSVVQRMGRAIADTCMVWKTDSTVQRDLARGRLRDLPQRLYPKFSKRIGDAIKKFE